MLCHMEEVSIVKIKWACCHRRGRGVLKKRVYGEVLRGFRKVNERFWKRIFFWEEMGRQGSTGEMAARKGESDSVRVFWEKR